MNAFAAFGAVLRRRGWRAALGGGLLAGCAHLGGAPPDAPPGGAAPPAERLAAQALAPLARFLGDWDGTSESLGGTFRVHRRIEWLVPDSWLLVRTATQDPESGQERGRTAALYMYDAAAGAVVMELLGPGGARARSWLSSTEDGASWEVRAAPDAEVRSLFRTVLFNEREWHARNYERDPAGGWREVERLVLVRRP